MKKLFIGLLIVLVLALVSIYIFIPGKLAISKIVAAHCTITGAYRHLSDEGKWRKWWKEGDQKAAQPDSLPVNSFRFGSDSYRVTNKYPYAVEISILHSSITYLSIIKLVSLNGDSVAAQWDCPVTTSASWNPVERVRQYREATAMRNNMSGILQNLQAFLDRKENVYGSMIERTSTKDTLLVSAKKITAHYPGTDEIYGLISHLKAYLAKEDAMQTGYPMVNILKTDSGVFQLMVALPCDKQLNGNSDIAPKRLVPGHFMVTEIKGGPYTINEALNQVQLYVEDYKKTVVAIPFQNLVTDRIKVPDTTKWITRIYMPVIK